MKFNIDAWTEALLKKVRAVFGLRLLFLGLQGSYNRGEATDASDIDIVVILDSLNLEDLKVYKSIIASMPNSEKTCGFICGKKELSHWTKSDLFQFQFDTRPLYGKLETILSPLEKKDISAAVKIGAENLYHSLCHSFLFSPDIKKSIATAYKMTFFILQAEFFLLTGNYIATKKDLLEELDGKNKEILLLCMHTAEFTSKSEQEIENLYETLVEWCGEKITKPEAS